MTASGESVQQFMARWQDAVDDERWWKYLVLPDYGLRERLGYTAAEAAWRTADALHVASDRLSDTGGAAHRWATTSSRSESA